MRPSSESAQRQSPTHRPWQDRRRPSGSKTTGRYLGSRDGLDDPYVGAMEALLTQYPQAVLVKAAGNDGERTEHVNTTLTQDGNYVLTIHTDFPNPAAVPPYHFIIDGWFRDNTAISAVSLRSSIFNNGASEVFSTLPNGLLAKGMGQYDTTFVDGGMQVTIHAWVDEPHGKDHFWMEVIFDSYPTTTAQTV